jgi:threonine/homoserine/homoserine lactone efflux protein
VLTLVTIFFSSFIIALSGALMPGPLLTATISKSAQRGSVSGPLLIIGHGILEAGLIVVLLMGLAPYLKNDGVFAVIAVIGAAILLWMAFQMFRTLPSLSLSWEGQSVRQDSLVIAGALLSIANPYWSIWWATIGLGYILYSWNFGLMGVFFFFCGHILADLIWYSMVSLAVARGRKFLNDRLYRGLIGSCAAFLIVFACYFVYAGVSKLL